MLSKTVRLAAGQRVRLPFGLSLFVSLLFGHCVRLVSLLSCLVSGLASLLVGHCVRVVSCLPSCWSLCPLCLPPVFLCLGSCLPSCWSLCPACLPSVSFCFPSCLPRIATQQLRAGRQMGRIARQDKKGDKRNRRETSRHSDQQEGKQDRGTQ